MSDPSQDLSQASLAPVSEETVAGPSGSSGSSGSPGPSGPSGSSGSSGPSASARLAGKLSFDDFTSYVNIVVGPEKREVLLPVALVSAYSDFLKVACNERWESGRKKVVTLAEEDPEIFAVFITWLYKRDLHDSSSLPPLTTASHASLVAAQGMQWDILSRCWVLGSFLQAAVFQNAVVDKLIETQVQAALIGYIAGSGFAQANFIYQNTAAGSPLRRMLLHQIIHGAGTVPKVMEGIASPAWYEEFLGELCEESIRMNRYGEEPVPVWERACEYHVHPGMPAGWRCARF